MREQRLKAPPGVRRWSKAWLIWLEREAALSEQGRWVVEQHRARLSGNARELRFCEERLERATVEDPLSKRLRALKGVGLVTACTLRAEIGRFDRFGSGKQLSRFCGLSPANRSSGTRVADAGLIDTCNQALRVIIVEAAHRLARYDERWSLLAHRLRQQGKPASLVIAAVANHWMRWLWQQLKQALPPEP